jgi:HD-GYP domain-containing protein (c-di-GMP phosphodiesterase class II)
MSSDRPSDARSAPAAAPDTSEFELNLASLVALRGSALLEGVEAHTPGAKDHADATAAYAFATAVELGFQRDRAEAIRESARLHEIGNAYVPVTLLAKPADSLTADERDLLAARPESAYRLARGAALPEQVCEWIRLSAERWDGSGPGKVGGEAIPIEARIARAACMCDTVLAAPGGTAADRQAATVAALNEAAGTELDPDVVEALVRVLERAVPA